jgi:uncharacterized protein YjbI with pentapeptide repeats
MSNLKTKLTKAGKWIKADWIRLFLSVGLPAFLGFAIFLYLSPYWQWADWTGLGADSNITTENTWENGKIKTTKVSKQFQSGKTLWDWLGLAGVIAIPIVLYQFQQQQQKRSEEQAEVEKKQAQERADIENKQAQERADLEKEIAATNLREEALQNYIDKMAELLIDKELKILLEGGSSYETLTIRASEIESSTGIREREQFNSRLNIALGGDRAKLDAGLDIARARTLSILRRLDGDKERKGSVVRFLIDAELIQGLDLLKGANLTGVDLQHVSLSRADLSEVNFSGANLLGVNFEEADLSSVNFSQADLSHAQLQGAKLHNAQFSGVDFSFIKLAGVDLRFVNLKGVTKLNPEYIKESAINWKQARYDPNFREQLGLPPDEFDF